MGKSELQVLIEFLKIMISELVEEPHRQLLSTHVDSFFNPHENEGNDLGKLLRDFFGKEKFFAEHSTLVDVLKCVSQA